MKHCILILFCLVAISSSSATNDQSVLNNTELPQQLWHDLITPNLEESKLFYGAVFGWTFKDTNFKGTKFTTIYNNGKIIGGMIEVKSAKSSTWVSALPLTSEDLNQRIKKVVAAGAKAVLPPVKIPGRGKQVVFEGLQGEEFSLISQNDYTNNMNSDLSDNNWLGMELWASNTSEAKEFYEVAFGVTTTKTTYDKKPYWLFNSGSDPVAGMMNNPIKNQGTQWVPYIKVSRLSESFMKIEKTKAYIILSPSKDVRNGEVGIIQDPHGAIIAIQKIKS